MDVFEITPAARLIDLSPPIPGYERFIGAYLFCGEKKAIVDVGPTAAVPNLLKALPELGIQPQEIDFIILTHIHIDHGGGTGTAVKAMDRAKVVVHQRGRSHLIDPTRLWQASVETLADLAHQYGEIEPVPEDRIIEASDHMRIDLGGGLVLETILTPGHAPHHLSVYSRADGVLISGEAAGACINGKLRPATPPPFKLDVTISSIDRLIELNPKLVCFSHFGCYDDGTERLKSARHKHLSWYKIVTEAAAAGKSPEDILVILRERDKTFDYLNDLSRDAYNREHTLLLNSVRGLASSQS